MKIFNVLKNIIEKMNQYVIVQSFTSSSVSCAANSAGSVEIPYTVPDGYEAIGVINVASQGAVVPSYYNTAANGKAQIWWRNPASYTITCSYRVDILFRKKVGGVVADLITSGRRCLA